MLEGSQIDLACSVGRYVPNYMLFSFPYDFPIQISKTFLTYSFMASETNEPSVPHAPGERRVASSTSIAISAVF